MISESKFMEELMKDITPAEAPAGSDKETYTRAEVDALIMEKIKEVKEAFEYGREENNHNHTDTGAEGGEKGNEEGTEGTEV